jgi:nucleoside-diphosphate-sugar epimerase
VKILVTGAAGDIGSRLIPALIEKGHQVKALVRRSSEQVKKLEKAGAEIKLADVTKIEELTGVCQNIDIVFHLAAVLWVKDPAKEIIPINYGGTKNVAQVCSAAKIKQFIFPSIALVIGSHQRLTTELPPSKGTGKTTSLHAEAKRLAEEHLLMLHKKGVLPVTILRLGAVYGPDIKLIELMKKLIRWGLYRIPGSGQNLLSLVHIDDAIQAMLLVIEKEIAKGKIYNIADDHPITAKEFTSILAKALGKREPGTIPVSLARLGAPLVKTWASLTGGKPFLTEEIISLSISSYAMDNRRAKEELGFKPKYPTFKEGVFTCL